MNGDSGLTVRLQLGRRKTFPDFSLSWLGLKLNCMAKYIEDIRSSYDFDSSIDPPYLAEDRVNFEFTIKLKILLKQVNPPKGVRTFMAEALDGARWPAVRWNDAAWIQFRNEYVKVVEEVWDKAFILIPPAKYDGFVWPDGGRRRNLLCRLRVKLVDQETQAHALIRVVRTVLALKGNGGFRSSSTYLDADDVLPSRKRFNPAGASFLQTAAAHEAGHLLGLAHVSAGHPACTAAHEAKCYGTNLADRMNIMGGGNMLDLKNAKPWCSRITEHVKSTDRADWKVDWASNEAQLRGLKGLRVDEGHKIQPPKPGIIDL